MLMDVADKEIRDTQVQIHTVAYERFKDHPEKEVSKILEFCRLEQDQAVEAYLRDRVVRKEEIPDLELFSAKEIEDIQEVLKAPQ